MSGPRLTLSLGEGREEGPVMVVDVSTEGGWRLKVARRQNGLADATVTDAEDGVRYLNILWPSVNEAIETACDYVRMTLDLPAVATVLKAMAYAELET